MTRNQAIQKLQQLEGDWGHFMLSTPLPNYAKDEVQDFIKGMKEVRNGLCEGPTEEKPHPVAAA